MRFLTTKPLSLINPYSSGFAGILTDYMKSVMPKDYFKDITISTALPVRSKRKPFMTNKPSFFRHMQVPFLGIQVSQSIDWSEFSHGREWLMFNKIHDTSFYNSLFADPDNDLFLKFQLSRLTTGYTISFIVASEVEAANILSHMKHTMPLNLKTMLSNKKMFALIPESVISYMRRKSPEMTLAEYNLYLKRRSYGAIDYLKYPGYERNVYGFYYNTNLMMFIGMPSVNITADDKVTHLAEVQFEVMFDAPVPLVYGIATNAIDDDYILDDVGVPGNTEFINCFIEFSPAKTILGSFQLTMFFSFYTSPDVKVKKDIIDLKDLMTTSDLEIYKQLHEENVIVKIWNGKDEVDPSNYKFDFSTLTVDLSERFFMAYKYSLGLYIDYSNFVNSCRIPVNIHI